MFQDIMCQDSQLKDMPRYICVVCIVWCKATSTCPKCAGPFNLNPPSIEHIWSLDIIGVVSLPRSTLSDDHCTRKIGQFSESWGHCLSQQAASLKPFRLWWSFFGAHPSPKAETNSEFHELTTPVGQWIKPFTWSWCNGWCRKGKRSQTVALGAKLKKNTCDATAYRRLNAFLRHGLHLYS